MSDDVSKKAEEATYILETTLGELIAAISESAVESGLSELEAYEETIRAITQLRRARIISSFPDLGEPSS